MLNLFNETLDTFLEFLLHLSLSLLDFIDLVGENRCFRDVRFGIKGSCGSLSSFSWLLKFGGRVLFVDFVINVRREGDIANLSHGRW